MKLCPDCEFIYEDDQSFCDMDGKELVFDPKPLSLKENGLSTSMQLEAFVATPAPLAASAALSLASALPPSLPPRSESRSLIVAALAGVVIAVLLLVAYYVRVHRLRSVKASQSHNQSFGPSVRDAISTPPAAPDSVVESAPAAQGRQATSLASATVR